MKNFLFSLSFLLFGVFAFANNSSESFTSEDALESCTISTTRTVDDANGDSHEVTVTNTGRTCYDAWSANQDELQQFEEGIEPAQ